MPKPDENEIQRLRDSEEKYRKMIERANDGIFAIDPKTAKVLEANPKAEEMTGYSSAELVGMNIWELHPPEERELTDKLRADVLKAGSGSCPDLHFATKSGARVAVDVSASVIELGKKRIIQRICRDVTERRRMEKEHEDQRQFYEFILDTLPVGLGVRSNINSKPSVRFENKAIQKMFGPDKHPSRRCRWCDTPEELPKKVTLDDTGVYAEERHYPDDRVLQFTIHYYRNLENSWSELQLVRDVTERRRLEDELGKAKEHLERKVEARTLELRQKQTQLVQSEKMAALGHLVAGVAHEVNTPLAALKSNNDLVVRSLARLRSHLESDLVPESVRKDGELRRLLDGVEGLSSVNTTAMDRIVTLVRSLRKFARLDEAEQDKVDIHEGLESTLTLVHHELKNRITVHKDYGKLPVVNIFPNRVNQVFMNVLVNASQAIEGKGDIHIKTYRRDDNLVVEFRDTGKGISQEDLGRIFDPGFTTKGVGIGTGLGLSIVYQIIQDHDGDIEVESEVGKGTTVRIVLPIR
jgi:PAS domain S-box-containing protein